MNNNLFTSIIKCLKNRLVSRNKDSKDSLVQWQKLAGKYKLADRSLILKDQNHKWIVPKSQYYPLMYTFHNNPMVGYLGYKKVLQKLTERYY